MDTDDLELKTPRLDNPKDLDVMSIKALGEYITELEAEIDRVSTAIAAKEAAKSAADAFFKK